MSSLIEHQGDLYGAVLLAMLALTLIWEAWCPRREDRSRLSQRWPANFALLFINLVVIYLVFPISAVVAAELAAGSQVGLFHYVSLPPVIAVALGMLIIDLGKYVQHSLMHRVAVLWRVHRTHHSDPACDVTTSLRFHPLESVLSVAVDVCLVFIFGVALEAVVLYRIGRVALSTWVHGNVRLAPSIEHALRYLVVTPDLHRIHHSMAYEERECNLGGGLIYWDRLFGTYRSAPSQSHSTMRLGVSGYSEHQATALGAILLDPISNGPRPGRERITATDV